MNGDLTDLAGALRGTLIVPGDAAYEHERLVWNSRYDDVRPAALARVADAADVATVLGFARDTATPLIRRSGGHCFAGASTGEGLVLDLSGLTDLTVDERAQTVTLGAGATLFATYSALWEHSRMAICGGTCPTVGIAGLTLGGGLGFLSRVHGVTCDSLVAAEVVTPDGEPHRVDEKTDADLLWALRGGGAASGVTVTALALRLVPVDMLFTQTELVFGWDAAQRAVAGWQAWLPAAPRTTWSSIMLLTQPPADGAQPKVVIETIHAGPAAELDANVDELVGAIGAAPEVRATHSGPFVDVEHDIYCKGFRPSEIALVQRTADGKVPRPAICAASDIAGGPWPEDGIATLVDWVERRRGDPVLTPTGVDSDFMRGGLMFEPADGAVNEVPAGDTAFVHRDNLFAAQFIGRWAPGAPRHVVDANVDWLEGFYAAIAPYRSGASYQNYCDAQLVDPERAYYGANLEKLDDIRRRRDGDL